MPIRAIEPLSSDFRHAQIPGNPGPTPHFYEWWYFEVELEGDNGRPYRIITSFHYPHALDARRVLAHEGYQDYHSRYGDHPGHYAGIASYVVDVRETKNVALLISRFRLQDIGTRVTVSRPGAPRVELRFGNSSFLENPDGTFTLKVAQKGLLYVSPGIKRPLELSLVAHFTQRTPGFQPEGGVLVDQSGVKHHWACVMPNPTVTIEGVRVLRKRNNKWTSLCTASAGARALGGYHDHQWGSDMFYKQIARWSWGRVPLDHAPFGSKVLFFDVSGRAGGGHPAAAPDPVLVEIPASTSPPHALTPIAGFEPFERVGPIEKVNFADGCRLGVQGQNVPYHHWAMVRGRNASNELRHLRVEHRDGDNVDTWPFYLRFAPEVELANGDSTPSISEIMVATRLELASTHKLLKRSEEINVQES